MSHCPSSPTRTGQVPMFLQLAASSLSLLRRREQRNKVAILHAEDCMSRDQGASATPPHGWNLSAPSKGVVLRMRTLTLNKPSLPVPLRLRRRRRRALRSRTRIAGDPRRRTRADTQIAFRRETEGLDKAVD